MVCDTSKIVEWLKQPSTIKFVGGLLSAFGFVYTQADLEKWTAAAVGFSLLINGLYDNNPRRPPEESIDSLSDKLVCMTPEQRVELMKLYKEKSKVKK